MAVLVYRDNGALDTNPPVGDQHLTEGGSDWLWAVTAVYTVCFLSVYGLSFVARAGERVFHYLYSVALLVGAVAYFAMASDLGFSVVEAANETARGLTRQIFFAKYIHWVVAFPSIIVALGLLSGISWATIVYQIFLAWFWILTYLAGAYTETTYKWGFFAFGTVAWLVLAASILLVDGHRAAARNGVARDHGLLACWLNVLWLLYPIAYGLTDGGNRIGQTQGFIFFGLLDVLMVPVLAAATLVLARNWDYARLNLAFTQYGRVPVAAGQFPEKNVPAADAAGAATEPEVPAPAVTV